MTLDDDLRHVFKAVSAQLSVRLNVRLDEFGEKADVADGETKRIHLGQPLFVRQRRNMSSQAFERLVNRLHPPTFSHIGRLSLLHLLLLTFPLASSRLADATAGTGLTLIRSADDVAEDEVIVLVVVGTVFAEAAEAGVILAVHRTGVQF